MPVLLDRDGRRIAAEKERGTETETEMVHEIRTVLETEARSGIDGSDHIPDQDPRHGHLDDGRETIPTRVTPETGMTTEPGIE